MITIFATRTLGAYGPLVLEYGDCLFCYYYNCFCWKLGVFEISIMFGNQNIHFWEGLFSKCFFFTSCSCFWIFGFLDFFFFFFFLVRCKKRDGEGKKGREGDQARFFTWIKLISFLYGLAK